MNTETLAARVGANWNEIAAILRTVGPSAHCGPLDCAAIESVRTVPARINNRLTRSLGRVRVNRGTRLPLSIELSGQLVALGEPAEIIAVLLHEIAHLAADTYLAGIDGLETPHGPTWGRFARALGVPASATTRTSYTARGAGLKTVAVCGSCGFELQKRRRLNQKRTYTHRDCGGTFSPR
jgi:predicted SprT family Zn-dependent metalloprotease